MRVTVNWVPDLTLDEDLAHFRALFPDVTFTPDPGYVPGPGSDQWPAVIIESPELAQFQSAVREFAVGGVSEMQWVEEHWKYAPATGELLQASFTWMTAAGQRVGTDVALED